MSAKANSKILSYQYPKILFKLPYLVRIIFVLNYFFQLRKWTLIKAWKKSLQKLQPNFVALDIGAGEAQYLIPFCRAFPKAQFVAIDKHIQSVLFVNQYPSNNISAELIDIEKELPTTQADLILCAGVIQYIQNDLKALKNFYLTLKNNGQLLLYVPINGKQYTWFYQWVFKHFPNYETIHQRQRIYTEKELLEKLNTAGFKVVEKHYTYGPVGAINHEISTSLVTLILQGNWLLKLGALLVFLCYMPLQLLLMLIDYHLPKQQGNGLLLKATKH